MPTQAKILNCGKRFVQVAGGEQSGKSKAASKWLLQNFPADLVKNEGSRDPLLYWLVADDYDGTRREFEYIVEDFTALFGASNIHASKVVNPGYIEIKVPNERGMGIRIETKSAADPRKLRMQAPNGIIGCEASQLDLETFNRIMGRVAPKRGWVFLSGSFEEGSIGWFPQIWAAWRSGADDRQSFSLPATENTYMYPGGENDPEILRLKADSSDAWFLERIMGVPVPPRGLVFGEFRHDLHIGSTDSKDWNYAGYIPGHPITLAIDPGYGHAYAVEVSQDIDGRIRWIDEVFERGMITSEITSICLTRPWWKDVTGGTIDIGGTQHQAMSSPQEVWLAETGIYLTSQKVPINQGTERFKSFLKVDPLSGLPRIVFSPHNKGVLSELGAGPNPFDGQSRPYKWKVDKDGQVVGDTPEDRNNDGLKAITYMLVDRYGYVTSTGHEVIKVRRYGSSRVKVPR